VLAIVGKDTLARLRVEPLPAASGQSVLERSLLSSSEGLVQASVQVPAPLESVRVSVAWQAEDGLTRSVSRDVRKR